MRRPGSGALTLGVLAIFYAVGVVGHLVPELRPWMRVLTPWFLLGAGGAAFLVFAWGAERRSLLTWLLPVFLITLGLEIVGVATGWIFGPYVYTDVLGTLLAGVPPVIGWNWSLVVLGFSAACRAFFPRWPASLRIVVVALACVAFDGLLEPVAIALQYWIWTGGEVPLQNYVAWGAIALAGAWWAERFEALPARPLLAGYAALQALFFLVLNLAQVHW